MAAELVGGAFLQAALQVAFERLASRDIKEYFRGRKLKDGLLEKLDTILISVNQLLEDAEERQYENPNVEKWLDKLKDAVYVAEDLFNEIALKATRQKLEAESQTATSKMSEDLLHCTQGYKSAYELGEDFINDLQSRSFFQSAHYDGYFTMHDLVNDLTKSVSGEFCLQIEGGGVPEISTKVRHISYLGTQFVHDKRLAPINKCESLRSLLLLQPCSFVRHGCMVSHDFSQFKYLRSLSLPCCQNIKELVSDINNLKHLHYLDLSSTSIAILPNSICTLYNLQILKLHYCSSLVELPQDLYKLINLCYLDITNSSISQLPNSICQLQNLQTLILEGCGSLVELPPNFHKLVNLCHLNLRRSKIREMPMQMGMLENVQILTDFFVGRQSGTDIMELGKLNHLEGTLTISELQNVNDPMHARETMKDNKFLNGLELVWSENNEDSQNERSVLEALQPHINLKSLTIANYSGTIFVDWLDAPYLPI